MHEIGGCGGLTRFLVDHDVWLTPAPGEPPVPLGTFRCDGGDAFAVRRRMVAFTPFTYVANVTGQPAMSPPTYWTSGGLPLGTHWLGRFGDEATLFRLAAQLEAARPWRPGVRRSARDPGVGATARPT